VSRSKKCCDGKLGTRPYHRRLALVQIFLRSLNVALPTSCRLRSINAAWSLPHLARTSVMCAFSVLEVMRQARGTLHPSPLSWDGQLEVLLLEPDGVAAGPPVTFDEPAVR